MATDGATKILIETGSGSPWDFTTDYLEAETPWITSQKVGVNKQDLFKFYTLSHGVHSNYEVKVGISNVRPAGTIGGSEYGDFDVVVRFVDQSKLPQTPFTYEDEDLRPNVIESFKCSLDPNSPKFISRVIGDRYITITDEGKVVVNGDYSNKSKYIRVEATEAVTNGGVSPNLIPFGFRATFNHQYHLHLHNLLLLHLYQTKLLVVLLTDECIGDSIMILQIQITSTIYVHYQYQQIKQQVQI